MADPRFLVVGAGAIGGTLAVGLAEHGIGVEVVARGAHLAAIRSDGLTRIGPDGSRTERLTAHATITEAVGAGAVDDDTVVVMATKVHQVEPLLDELLAVGGPDVCVATAHNGLEGERLALRRFAEVQSVLINTPGVHVRPGEVEIGATEPRGVLDVGRYPHGVDDRTRAIAAAWTAAGFLSEPVEHLQRRKWAKLLGNTGNALQVLCGRDPAGWETLYDLVRAEAEDVAEVAGIEPDLETQQARAAMVARAPIADRPRPGSSTLQSALRARGELEGAVAPGDPGTPIEVLAINGEIALLGRLFDVPTPANALVVAEAVALLASGDPLGSRSETELLARLGNPSPRPRTDDPA